MISRRPVFIATEIKMKRSQYRGTFLIVEGRDDKVFCRRFVDPSSCAVIVAEDKERVCEVIRILDQDQFAGVVGLVDADFDHIEGRATISPNLFPTELHDLECVQIRSGALDAVLAEFGSLEKLLRFGPDVRPALLEAACMIGYLRLHSQRCRLGLRFDGLRYSRCIDSDSLGIDAKALVQEVKNRAERPEISDDTLLQAIEDIQALGYDPWQLCNGTDLLAILSLGLRRALGTNSTTTVTIEQLRQILRAAFGHTEFAATDLRRRLQRWEAKNPQFRIFG